MKSFSTSTLVHANPEKIWALLTDAAGYPRWNSTVARVDGSIVSGGSVTLCAKRAPGRAFALKVTKFLAPREMVWEGGMPLGLFSGTRTFSLTPQGGGKVGFVMAETYRGLMAPLILRSFPDLQPDFDAFAADLKREAEAVRAPEMS